MFFIRNDEASSRIRNIFQNSQGQLWNYNNINTTQIIMSFKASIDIAIHFHSLRTLLFKHQGLIKIRCFVFYENINNERVYAHPFNIIKRLDVENKIESGSDEATSAYISKSLFIKSEPQEYMIQETCIYRLYLEVNKLNNATLRCNVELLYSPDYVQSGTTEFKIFHIFEGKINRASRLLQYLPISFDQYDGFGMKSFYTSVILQFKFMKEQEEKLNEKYDNFWEYFQAVTSNFQINKTKEFYQYYRNFIEEEFEHLQERYAFVQTIINQHNLIQSKFKFLRNTIIDSEIQALNYPGFYPAITYSIFQKIQQEFINLKAVCYDLWNKFIELLVRNSTEVTIALKNAYQQKCVQRLKNNVFSHIIKNLDWKISHFNQLGKQNIQKAEEQKKKNYHLYWKEQFVIENMNYFPLCNNAPKLFEQIFNVGSSSKRFYNENHIIVMVHGFQASRSDFLPLKNLILTQCQNVQIMISGANQGRTHCDIEIMGHRLALQISEFIAKKMGNKQYRLSFIGHSMGGIIIRAALVYLQRYWSRMYTYISLSSPHLGYLYNQSAIVQAGLWYLNSWQKCESIKQLMMMDCQDMTDTFMFRLSKLNKFQWFKNVVLVSSYQDGFISYESARIQKTNRVVYQTKHNQRIATTISNMVDNILVNNLTNLHRIDVVFDIKTNDFDSLIGRTAHIKMLSDKEFLKIFVNSFIHFFK